MAFRKAARLAAGKPWSPRPYTQDKLVKDFSVGRALASGPDETRQLADMRRSGAVEGDAGGGRLADQSNNMANTVSADARLRKTYSPVNDASVRRFDEARAIGARGLEQKPSESVKTPVLVTLLGKQTLAKCLI
jgi:hypothetical protein